MKVVSFSGPWLYRGSLQEFMGVGRFLCKIPCIQIVQGWFSFLSTRGLLVEGWEKQRLKKICC
jgi:hypothetical protein